MFYSCFIHGLAVIMKDHFVTQYLLSPEFEALKDVTTSFLFHSHSVLTLLSMSSVILLDKQPNASLKAGRVSIAAVTRFAQKEGRKEESFKLV